MDSRTRAALLLTSTVCLLILALPTAAVARPGQVDPGVPLSMADLGFSVIRDTATTADGRFVVAGEAYNGAPVVARLDSGGQLDTSFGSNGEVWLGENHSGVWDVSDIRLAVDAQGRIVIAGTGPSTPGMGDANFTLVRLRSQGTVDDTFGANGWMRGVMGASAGTSAQPIGVRIDSSGRIIVAGTGATYDPFWGWRVTDVNLARITAAGTLDSSFGNGGRARVASDGSARALAVDAQGRAVVAIGQDTSIGIMRLTAVGAPDPTFGVAGLAAIDAADQGTAWPQRVVIDTSGRPLVAGSVYADGWGTGFVARTTAAGHPDSGFGDGGIAVVATDDDSSFTDLTVDGDGVIAVGSDDDGYDVGFLAARFNGDGSADEDFGDYGYSIEVPYEGSVSNASGIVLLPNHRFAVIGITTRENDSPRVALLHYLNDWLSDMSVGSAWFSTTPLRVGVPAELNLSVWTNGPDSAPNASFSVEPGTGLTATGVDTEFGDCSIGATASCSVDWIYSADDGSEPWEAVVTLMPTAAGPTSINLRVGTSGIDPSTANDTRTVPVTVEPATAPPAIPQQTVLGQKTQSRDTTPPRVRLRIKARRLGMTLRKGLTMIVLANEPGAVNGRADVAAAVAKRFGLRARGRSLAVARGASRHLGTVVLRFDAKAKKALARARKVRLTLVVAVTDAAGNRGTTKRTVTLKR